LQGGPTWGGNNGGAKMEVQNEGTKQGSIIAAYYNDIFF
jgi:hypothetical protein